MQVGDKVVVTEPFNAAMPDVYEVHSINNETDPPTVSVKKLVPDTWDFAMNYLEPYVE